MSLIPGSVGYISYPTVAYLGFHKRGGPNFCWPLVLIQGGQTLFSYFFFNMVKNKIFAKGGPWPNGPPKYTADIPCS